MLLTGGNQQVWNESTNAVAANRFGGEDGTERVLLAWASDPARPSSHHWAEHSCPGARPAGHRQELSTPGKSTFFRTATNLLARPERLFLTS